MKHLLFLVTMLILVGCREGRESRVRIAGKTMGTTWSVVLRESPADHLESQVQRRLDELEALLSHWRSDSEVSVFNGLARAAPTSMKVSAEVAAVVGAGLRWSQRTDGAFNVALGHANGFGPAEDHASAAPGRSAHELLRLEDRMLTSLKAGVGLDLSALGKGYAVDEIARLLEQEGVHQYLVEIGGEIRSRGDGWRIGLEEPQPGPTRMYRAVELRAEGVSVATSGNYRLFEGAPFSPAALRSHLVSNQAEKRFRSVTVFAPTAMEADALATSLFVLPRDQARSLGRSEGVRVVFLDNGVEGIVQEIVEPSVHP